VRTIRSDAYRLRILGSRAREQVPGTRITLLAPGFRGALTQLSPGVATGGVFDLPFAGAAAGAEIMLASQLTLNLEARTAMGAPGLRSRSAVAGHPRVIVPRQPGVACALLQTDETGASSFLLPASNDDEEAVFRLTVAAQGSTRRSLRVLMWPIYPVLAAGAQGVATRWEALRRPNHLAQWVGAGRWAPPDWDAISGGAVLLLLHDTFTTAQAAFTEWIGDESFESVHRAFGGRCLAFTHPTLGTSVDENLDWLAENLANLPGPIDVVAHGRGGLLARAIAADGRLNLRRACQVGTPNNGTPLALPANLPRFLDAHVTMLARTRPNVAQPTLEGALCMLRFVALGLSSPLVGMEPLLPGNAALRIPSVSAGDSPEWFTISAQFAKAVGHADESLHEFALAPNDLVTPVDGCHEPGGRVSDSLKLGGTEIHHHNYFTNQHVRERLAAWFVGRR
jgi:hypothetical protein